MNNEIWRDCKGYEGRYQVSNMGRVWSVKAQKYLTPQTTNTGYLEVMLKAINGKYKHELIHRLVALAFLDNPNGFPQVNHKDENKANNCLENLEWCSCKYNTVYSVGKSVRCIEKNKVFDCAATAQKELKIDSSSIHKCCKGIRKTAGGYHWEYSNAAD